MKLKTCRACGSDHSEQWWSLSDYHGFSGVFCARCYDSVRHTAWDQPVNPRRLTLMRLRLDCTAN